MDWARLVSILRPIVKVSDELCLGLSSPGLGSLPSVLLPAKVPEAGVREVLQLFADAFPSQFCFTSVYATRSPARFSHVGGSVGPIIVTSLGDYSGGDLCLGQSSFNTRHRLLALSSPSELSLIHI